MKTMSLAIAGLLAATLTASAQPRAPGAAPQPNAVAAPQPPVGGPAADAPPPPGGPAADMPPPPPGAPRGPRGDRPPPPPRGAAIRIDRGPEGAIHLDIHCGERDSTKDCADTASQLLDKLNTSVKPQ